jgi:hypothetical protein
MTAVKDARRQGAREQAGLMWLLYVADAGLLIASGLIHLHLWDIAYRHVKTLDALFLVQVVLTLLAAAVLLATRRPLVAAGSAVLLTGTIAGFLLARTAGIFGFHLTFISTEAYVVLVIEAVGVVMLGVTAWLGWRVRSTGKAT